MTHKRFKSFEKEANKVSVIHYFDVDIQGSEVMLCDESFLQIIISKVKILKIGTHSHKIHEKIIDCFKDKMDIVSKQKFGRPGFVMTYLRKQKNWGVIRDKSYAVSSTPFGPVLNWDGTILLKNPIFDQHC